MSMIDDVKKSISEERREQIMTASDLMSDQGTLDQIEEPEAVNLDEILANAPTDEKGNRIIDDQIFDKYVKLLPAGTINKSGTWRAANKGKIKIFGGDPEADKAIHRAGADASNAAQAHRRTLADDLRIALSKKATRATLADLDLSDGATNQDAITAAAILQATQGNVKALQYIRDTIGEQPTTKQDINVGMTDADRSLLDKIDKRLNG